MASVKSAQQKWSACKNSMESWSESIMTKEMLRKTSGRRNRGDWGEQIRQHRPLVHCITNPIAIHDSANIVLAAGGRPIMAEHPQEVEEIVRTAQVLVLNLGNITDVRMSSMKKAFQEALKNRVPTVLDLVGIQCSSLRLHYAKELLEIGSPTVLKGNMSEMRKLAGLSTYGTGVDAGEKRSVFRGK